jgi:hypothetical protein
MAWLVLRRGKFQEPKDKQQTKQNKSKGPNPKRKRLLLFGFAFLDLVTNRKAAKEQASQQGLLFWICLIGFDICLSFDAWSL